MRRQLSSSRSFHLLDIRSFNTARFCFPVLIAGFRDTCFRADILDDTSGFDGLQNGNDLVFGELGFTDGDLVSGHNQYVGISLKVNGSFCRGAYISDWCEMKVDARMFVSRKGAVHGAGSSLRASGSAGARRKRCLV